ncbi:hypothetical protein MPSEU_000013500 [Mayamaea pseudoterrestris]|nr:hypothetical protein MPSEU_000013500 [Mayamaea pseudoterrestris]
MKDSESKTDRQGRGSNRKKNHNKNFQQNKNAGSINRNNNSSNVKLDYPPHLDYQTCLDRYHDNQQQQLEQKQSISSSVSDSATNPTTTIIRGKLRVLPFGNDGDAVSFVSCDQGRFAADVCIPSALERNRAMHGDTVFVEILDDSDANAAEASVAADGSVEMVQGISNLNIGDEQETACEEVDIDEAKVDDFTWQDDVQQMDLWNPLVSDIIKSSRPKSNTLSKTPLKGNQAKGRVVCILPSTSIHSELDSTGSTMKQTVSHKCIVGTLFIMQSGTILLTPNNKSLPQFKCDPDSTQKLVDELKAKDPEFALERTLFKAQYVHGSWLQSHKWPPCTHVEHLGESFIVENEIQALLTEFDVDHGEFDTQILAEVESVVASGVYRDDATGEMGWKPTLAMYENRRDYRQECIFTIDPTTAKDLDDALHVKQLDEHRVEVGVHIADVSYFVRPNSRVDKEALRRSTTVYLVDRTIPMLPRPLCEIACSLNENVERLAFSCVWIMNMDGTLRSKSNGSDGAPIIEDVWYGRTVIRSCARLDYATAQNIIDGKVAAIGASTDGNDLDEALWPSSRRPTDGHTVAQVAANVRLLHKVGMARRKLRFDHGALALHGIKLSFTLDADGRTPLLAAPYPIRDSNRLVEEFMLLANFLVAQRLITHTGDLALLRCHSDPSADGLDDVVEIAKTTMDFDIDTSSSQTLHDSLIRFSRTCDELLLQCFTNLLMTPMQPAEYFAAGSKPSEEWRHYALNIPYYTHFTSPIRRYPDVVVHRLLQASIDGAAAIERFPLDVRSLEAVCENGNEKKKASKDAQERCDRVFLSLFLHKHPKQSELGVVLSVGTTTFEVYLPSLGTRAKLFLLDHRDMLTYASSEDEDGTKRILLQRKADVAGEPWETIEIAVFVKLSVTILCRDRPPVDIKLRLEGPWKGP